MAEANMIDIVATIRIYYCHLVLIDQIVLKHLKCVAITVEHTFERTVK